MNAPHIDKSLGPGFESSRLCAIRYLAGILELPRFWSGGNTHPERFFDILSNLCNTLLRLIQDTEGNLADGALDSSSSMSAARQVVDILSCVTFDGLLRLPRLNIPLPDCPVQLPTIIVMFMR